MGHDQIEIVLVMWVGEMAALSIRLKLASIHERSTKLLESDPYLLDFQQSTTIAAHPATSIGQGLG